MDVLIDLALLVVGAAAMAAAATALIRLDELDETSDPSPRRGAWE